MAREYAWGSECTHWCSHHTHARKYQNVSNIYMNQLYLSPYSHYSPASASQAQRQPTLWTARIADRGAWTALQSLIAVHGASVVE